MYAVFETGGKQYKAEKGDVVFVEKLAAEPGKSVSFDALMIADGGDVMIGTPIVRGAKVKATVIEHGKERKIVVFKYKPKKDYRRKQGHRQPFTKIEITGITAPGGKEAEEAPSAVETKPAAKAAAAKPAAAKAAAEKTTAAKAAVAKPAEKPAVKPAAVAKPAAKPAAAKTAAAKAPKAETAEKPAAKPAAAKKPAAKPAEDKPAAAKKPAAKKPAEPKKETE